MTIRPMFIKCARCKKKYSWNPDIGKVCCTHCGFVEVPGRIMLEQIMAQSGKKRK